ncbi:MAG: DUF4331 domain-containing protein [Polaromonas sp.]|nr:DUF4331 domain-containing protein [Polaromonas sp.]
MKKQLGPLVKGCLLLAVASAAMASSHREAPFITGAPKVDGTDFYMFRSYEGVSATGTGGRSDYVTLLSNYQPLQSPYGGPNYFQMDPNALYEIHLDNTGDGVEDITFQFRFKNTLKGTALTVGGTQVPIPLIQSGPVAGLGAATLNVNETYGVKVVRGPRRSNTGSDLVKTGGGATFEKPVDYIGTKTIANYPAYAAQHIHTVTIPGCPAGKDQGKVFVGQRQEGFAANLGPIFDLVNAPAAFLLDPANKDAAGNGGGNHIIQKANVTTLAIEVHKDCLTNGAEPVIGGWTTASLRQGRLVNPKPGSGNDKGEKAGGAWVQVSRLGNPLINELVIGLPDKDKFNASAPADDAQFLNYVINPSFPPLLSTVLGANVTPTNLPRTDLATTFLTGITGINKPQADPKPSEMLRLDTSKAPAPFAAQNRLGVAGNALAGGTDNAGFPTGRRPKDDVVDIALVAMVGGLCVINGDADTLKLNSIPGVAGVTSACRPASVPLGATAANIHDAVDQATVPFLLTFPYLNTPNAGSASYNVAPAP